MKKMKIILFVMAIFTMNAIYAQSYKIDVTNSTLKWHGKKVTGEHFGNIGLKDGILLLDNDQISGGKFIIDMTSITNTDLTDAGYNAKLVGHLKSDDFFGVEKHPEALLEIIKSSAFKNNVATIDGNLTIKKIKHPVTFTVTKDGNAYSAEIVVDRSKYDVRYGSGSFFDNLGDNMIYDEFTMNVKIMLTQAINLGS